MTDTEAPPAEQVYDGPAPGSQEFQGRRLQTAGLASERERSQAMLCHLLAFAGFFVPFGNIIGPLIVWKANKADSDFVDAHGKASLNFQISLTLFAILGALSGQIIGSFNLILFLFFLIAAFYGVVMTIVNSVRAHNGEDGAYAYSTHFLK